MGIFSDIKATKDIALIKSGGTAKLSISQITGLITNMLDAKKNLSSVEYDKVFTLFKDFRKCKTKIEMNVEGYLETAEKIIKRFDSIAPYQKYGRGNEIEYSFMMEDMRNTAQPSKSEEITFGDEDYKMMNQLIEESFGSMNQEDAKDIMIIVRHHQMYGKEQALKEFDILAQKLIAQADFDAVTKVSFMTGLLHPSGVLTKEESDALGEKYSALAIEEFTNKIK